MPDTDRFTLHIEFAGMCLFVRDPRTQHMHVLMPRVHDHLARLFYRPEYDPANPPAPGERWRERSMEGVALDLTRLRPGASLGETLHPDIPDLTWYLHGRRVRRRFLNDPPPSDPVLCRITLNDGSLAAHNPGTRWRFGPDRRPMSISCLWTIRNVEAPLELTTQEGDLLLHPHAKQMWLALFNAPDDETPDATFPAPEPGERAGHFAEYYKLFEGETGPEPPRDPSTEISGRIQWASRGRRFTCIMAQGEADSV